MAEIKREGALISIGDTLRIEPGPVLLTGMAAEELLGPVTADHYHAPREATPEEIANPHIDTPEGIYYAKDALGAPIKLGEEMTFLDWNGFKASEAASTRFYLYELSDRPDPENWIDPKFWAEIGVFETEDAALSAAFAKLGA